MKKRTFTLIEIMIVILLISLIGGAIGYNMKGALKRGKDFKTEQARSRLEDFLEICLQDGMDAHKFMQSSNKEKFLKELDLAKDPAALLKDGNNQPFVITYDEKEKTFHVTVQ